MHVEVDFLHKARTNSITLEAIELCHSQVEMTGDYTPDLMALLSADVIVSTPEKWDGISRNWHSRSYVTKVQHCD